MLLLIMSESMHKLSLGANNCMVFCRRIHHNLITEKLIFITCREQCFDFQIVNNKCWINTNHHTILYLNRWLNCRPWHCINTTGAFGSEDITSKQILLFLSRTSLRQVNSSDWGLNNNNYNRSQIHGIVYHWSFVISTKMLF